MVNYQRLYHIMFNAATDALEALAQQNAGTAAELLRSAQQRAEELYLEQGGQGEAPGDGN